MAVPSPSSQSSPTPLPWLAPALPAAFPCPHCSDVFQRKDHLTRHLLRHSGDKQFGCPLCGKTFPRKDSLLRHAATHPDHAQSRDAIRRRTPQACLRCARLKQRCQGGFPCLRCIQKQTRCVYPHGTTASVEPSASGAPEQIPTGLSWDAATSAFAAMADNTLTVPLHEDPPTLTLDGSDEWSSSWLGFSDHLAAWMDMQGPSPWLPMPLHSDTMDVLMGHETEIPLHKPAGVDDPSPLYTPQDASSGLYQPAEGVSHQDHPPSLQQEPFARPNLTPPKSMPVPCLEFAAPTSEQLRIADTEKFGHLAKIPEQSFEAVRYFFDEHKTCDASCFIELSTFHAFVELFLEYFNVTVQLLHHTTLQNDSVPWVLLLASAAVGSQYSEIPDAPSMGLVLRHLLRRALEIHVPLDCNVIDVAMVQSLFLHHVLLTFSESRRDHLLQQALRSVLVSVLCRIAPLRNHHTTSGIHQSQDAQSQWRTWISTEERLRLFCCVHGVQCMHLIFVDQPPLFNLTDFVDETPCTDALWECRSAEHWQKMFLEFSGDPNPSQLLLPTGTSSQLSSFSRRLQLLELYTDDRLRSRQAHSSRLIKAMFTRDRSGPLNDSSRNIHPSEPRALVEAADLWERDLMGDELFDTDHNAQVIRHPPDLLVHLLAILSQIQLVTLYNATGWRTDRAGIENAKAQFTKFARDKAVIARKCLWHACVIYNTLRHAHMFTCYDVLTFCAAVCYIWTFCTCVPEEAERARPAEESGEAKTAVGATRSRRIASSAASTPSCDRPLIRLDMLRTKAEVESWMLAQEDVDVHMTGVGLLGRPNSCFMLLSDAIKILTTQPGWPGLAHSLARTFLQLRQGETPKLEIDS